MPLELYRRHNTEKCSSGDTVRCTNSRRPCPIWIRGNTPDGTYIRKPTGFRDWNEARKYQATMETTGEPPKAPRGKDSVEQLSEKYLENMRVENKSPDTIRKYEYLFDKLETFAKDKGIRFVSEFDLPTLADFRGTWKVGDATRQKEQERLRAVFRFAQARKMIEFNPATDLGKIKVKHKQKIPFTDEEMAAIIKSAQSRMHNETRSPAERERSKQAYALILLMRYTGLRISDATMLKMTSLVKDGKKTRVSLRTQKTDTLVEILVDESVVAALHAFKPNSKTHFFWDGVLAIKPLTNLYRDFYLKPVFKDAKLAGKPHPHQFRHTFASKLLLAGTKVDDVATLLGNSPQIVRKHYAAHIKESQDRLDDVVAGANGWKHAENAAKS